MFLYNDMDNNMKKTATLVLVLAAAFTFASCEREFVKSTIGTETVAPVLRTVSDQIVDANNSKAESVIFNWTPASFGAPTQIQYTLYMTREGQDDVLIGQTFDTSVAVEKATVNSGAVALGIAKNDTGTVGAKVVASVYTGSSTSYANSVTSNAISFNVTTFEAPKDFIFLPGFYNGWGESNDQEQWRVWEMDGGSKVYRTLVKFEEDATNTAGFCPFKLYAGGAWLGYNDGYEPAWGRIYENSDGNWAVPVSEPINFITVNMTTKKGSRQAIKSVGLIGSFAESGSWDHDVFFEYDNKNNVWVAGPVTFTATDDFLVHLNEEWGEFKYGGGTAISSAVKGGFELENGAQAANIASPGSGQYLVKLYTNRTPFVITYEAQ